MVVLWVAFTTVKFLSHYMGTRAGRACRMIGFMLEERGGSGKSSQGLDPALLVHALRVFEARRGPGGTSAQLPTNSRST